MDITKLSESEELTYAKLKHVADLKISENRSTPHADDHILTAVNVWRKFFDT